MRVRILLNGTARVLDAFRVLDSTEERHTYTCIFEHIRIDVCILEAGVRSRPENTDTVLTKRMLGACCVPVYYAGNRVKVNDILMDYSISVACSAKNKYYPVRHVRASLA
ncbi:hypothetical protein ANTQUA_LOCUS1123 [Anthophora quadrimaculata]